MHKTQNILPIYLVISEEWVNFEFAKRNNMKRKVIIYTLLSLLMGVLLLSLVAVRSCTTTVEKDNETEVEEPVDTTLVLVRQVRECAKLYTAEVEVHKIITHGDEMRMKADIFSKPVSIDLPFGERKIAIPIDATLKTYIDFSEFSERNVHRDGDQIEIVLPDPKVVLTQSKVRNEDIKKRVPLLRSNFTDEELTSYEAQGREDIIRSIPKMDIIPMAQEGAANVLIPLLVQLGYEEENIIITFRKEFTISDIRNLLMVKG